MKKQLTLVLMIMTGMVFSGAGTGKALPEPTAQVIQVDYLEKYADCRLRHDYANNHLPLDIPPFGDVPFPLTEGRITCRTCHFDVHQTGGANFPSEGLCLQQRDICFKCRQRQQYKRINPHEMRDEEGGYRTIVCRMIVCAVCQTNTPNPEADRSEAVRFRAASDFSAGVVSSAHGRCAFPGPATSRGA